MGKQNINLLQPGAHSTVKVLCKSSSFWRVVIAAHHQCISRPVGGQQARFVISVINCTAGMINLSEVGAPADTGTELHGSP